jgi:histidinol phosphatase-like PHP family hydrolase
MRLWIKDEVQVGDKQVFMDTLVERILGIMDHEPIDIYVNPTFLPDVIAKEYDALWTAERMRKVVAAIARNHVAMEINARYRLPRPAFIKLAKQAGVKFTMGTNNGDRNVGDLDYCLQMVRECGLTWQDMFVPKPDGQKPVQARR